ncbi:MAG: DNA primase [Rikenellaceae bacterium]|nr:DNA primase [Rikenellaceae bacterium]
MIDQLTIDRIFAAADIVDVVGDFVTLRRQGANYQACCPFHTEKTPSFVVSPAKGVFKCFGCGKGGNVVSFIMEHEGMGYVDALKYLGRKYGIEIQEKERTAEEVKRNDDRESMMVLNGWAAEYFKKALTSTPEGRNVGLSYFRERGFTEATIEKFGLGYCPEGYDTFSKAALAAGYKEEFLVGTGLSFKREGHDTLTDRFYGRVMFPIHTVSGRVLAFGGRTLKTDKTVAKYKNSPESEIYQKRMTLYGLFFAKKAISQLKCAILVEGYTDVISMHQAGVENVVASSGTSLTTEQVKLLKRFTENITVMYDGDAAGLKASLRGIDIILKEGMNVRIVQLPPEHDPDSFAKAHTADEVQEYIRSREEDFITFKCKLLMADSAGDVQARSAVIRDVVGSIAEIPDAITRAMYAKECAVIMDVDENLLLGEVAKLRAGLSGDAEEREFFERQRQQKMQEAAETLRQSSASNSGTAIGSGIEELERELTRYLIRYGHLSFDIKEGTQLKEYNVAETIVDMMRNVIGFDFQNPECRAIYECYVEHMTEPGVEVPLSHFINYPSAEVSNMAVNLLTMDDNYIPSKLWSEHDIGVSSERDRLSEALPRAIMLYKSKVIERLSATFQAQLNNPDIDEDTALDIVGKLRVLNNERNDIAHKLKRLIL